MLGLTVPVDCSCHWWRGALPSNRGAAVSRLAASTFGVSSRPEYEPSRRHQSTGANGRRIHPSGSNAEEIFEPGRREQVRPARGAARTGESGSRV